MTQQVMHMGGTQATYCGKFYNDERWRVRNVDQRVPEDGPLPYLPDWLRWCGSCARLRMFEQRRAEKRRDRGVMLRQ